MSSHARDHQNAFQMAHFIWTLVRHLLIGLSIHSYWIDLPSLKRKINYLAKICFDVAIQLTPGLKECYHANLGLSIMKVVVGLVLQVLCSYITFPLYALVTQVKITSDKILLKLRKHRSHIRTEFIIFAPLQCRWVRTWRQPYSRSRRPTRWRNGVTRPRRSRGNGRQGTTDWWAATRRQVEACRQTARRCTCSTRPRGGRTIPRASRPRRCGSRSSGTCTRWLSSIALTG